MAAATAERDKADELKGEAGEAVGAMPPKEPDGRNVAPDAITIEGSVQLDLFDAGGKRPTSSSLRLVGGSVQILDGQGYRKGEVLRFSGTAVVSEVAQKDRADPATKQVVSCEQGHKARITDLRIDSIGGAAA